MLVLTQIEKHSASVPILCKYRLVSIKKSNEIRRPTSEAKFKQTADSKAREM